MRAERRATRIGRVMRTGTRLAALAGLLASAAPSFGGRKRGAGRHLQRLCRRLLAVFEIRVHLLGAVPTDGLIVCNHLGYLDILVLGAAIPAVFVAKREVASWPVFGWFARKSGTIFVRRERRADSGQAASAICAALRTGVPVVLFPEGTSSGGEGVLPFKSSLLAPPGGVRVVAAALAYALEPGDGDPAEEISYWKGMRLLPHLLGVLAKRRIRAVLVLDPPREPRTGRKELAVSLRGRVQQLHALARAQAGRGLGEERAGPVLAGEAMAVLAPS